ncbi:HN1_G0030210.mRNA.1.CDS.1 [Saccharomyces cerevisiae]|nr:HN1_G0030210.mRNA.1.CDS.1 [Saccharomyces cerevisiae]CAI4628611.1 BAL_1a_G0037960.mRNA.1.CDS.1 [Saccharomyces cerevisiae]CAI7246435.1 BAL_1a_G0037960.mRNA.1.CDS.1 [Saccharomyces cerevisiae]
MRATTLLSSVVSLALLSKEVLATPPACLLACVAQVGKSSSTCDSLNQVTCYCEHENSAVKKCLDSICPNNDADAAYSAFKSSCSEQNASLGDSSSSASSSASSSSKTSSSTKASSSSASSSTKASSSSASSSTKASSSSAAPSSSKASSTESSFSTKAPSSEESSSTYVSSSKQASSTSEAHSSSAASSTVSQETASSALPTSTAVISTFSEGSGNVLEAGKSVFIAAVAAMLI